MSKRDWSNQTRDRIVFWACTAIAIIAITIALLTQPSDPSAREHHQDERGAEQSGHTYEVRSDGEGGFSFSIDRRTTEDNSSKQSDNNQLGTTERQLTSDEADLLAQEIMAHWTKCMGIFTAIGLWALVLTLRATERTLDEAQSATNATYEVINADRGWITLDGNLCGVTNNRQNEDGTFTPESYSFWYQFRNTGRSPATNIRAWSVFKTFDLGEEIPELGPRQEQSNDIAHLGPGQIVSTIEHRVPMALLIALERHQIRLVFGARLEYFDIYQREEVRHTEVLCEVKVTQFEHVDGRLRPRTIITPIGDGNSIS